MRKYILAILTFSFLFILTGCGSNSKPDGDGTAPGETIAVEMQKNQIVLQPNGTNFTLSSPFIKKLNSTYHVQLSGFSLSVKGCNISSITFLPASLVLDGAINTQETLHIDGVFDQKCNPSNYTLTTRQTVTQDDNIKHEDIFFPYDYSKEIGEGGYSITNATTPLLISKTNSDYNITMQVLKDGFVSAGKTVKLKPFDSHYGTINASTTYTVLSNENGIAAFDYLSPNILPEDGETVLLEAIVVDENDTMIAGPQNIVLDFNASGNVIDTTHYQLLAVPDVVNIPTAGESRGLSLYLNNTVTNTPVENQSIIAHVFNQTNGTLDKYIETTSSNGQVIFTYTAPATLPTSALIITFELKGGSPQLTETVKVNFGASSVPPVDTSNYQLLAVPDVVNIPAAGESKGLDLYLNNIATNQPVANQSIIAEIFNQNNGTLDKYVAITDANGHVVFNYTAPDTLPASALTITFIVEGGTPMLTETIKVDFAAAPNYNLTKETTPITIVTPNQVEIISVYLIDSITNLGVPGKIITLSTPGFGDLTSSMEETNAAGKVEFSYQAPGSLTGLTNTTVILSFSENGVTITKNVNITVSTITPGSSEYMLTNGSTPINIKSAKEIKEISVQLITKDGTVQAGKTIVAKSIPATFGTISNVNVLTGADGYARFTYIAADTLTDGVQPLELYYDDNGVRVSTIIEINITEAFSPLPQVVIPDDKVENNLTVNNQFVSLVLKVFSGSTNTPYSKGKVKVELPSNVTEGVDVGSFEAYDADIINGVATFKYTGPNDLQGLIDSGELQSIFMFYHEDNPTDKKSVTMIYDPDAGSGYIPVNYELEVSSQDGEMTMGLEKIKTFRVLLKDDQGNDVPSTSVTSIKLTSKNVFVGKLLDPGTSNEVDTITVSGKNSVNFNVKTDTKSGLLPIDIIANFEDPNGDPRVMNQTANIVVYSGPPTAMSISYAGVEHDEVNVKYIEKFAVTVVDAYNNKVNTQPYIAVGGMVEYAVDGSSPTGTRSETSPRLWYGKFDAPHGEIVSGPPTLFKTPPGGDIFKYVDFSNDKLVVFGEGYVYESLGKWDIQSNTDDILQLDDDYFGADRGNLLYAVGHNKRQDLCAADGREYVGFARSDTYQVGSDGTAFVEFAYDYHLTGKDIMLWVNLTGYQADIQMNTRIGEALKHTLRGTGFAHTPSAGYTLKKGTSGHGTFIIWHEDAPERYRNGHFGYAVKEGSTCGASVVATSNVFDARTCNNGGSTDGTSYITFLLTAPADSDCTFDIDNIMVSSEF